MQFGCIFFPLLDVYRSWKQNRHRYSDCSTLVDSNKRPVSSYRNRDLYSMASLEMQIEKNVEPLLKWAAQKEFTAENIVFLRAVRDFKKKWVAAAKRMPLSSDQERERYEEAALIFFTLVDLTTAKFNINVDHRTYLELSQVFASCKYHCYDDEGSEYSNYTASSNNACPWDNQDAASSKSDEKNLVSDVDKLYPVPVTEIMPTNSPVSSASSTFGDNSIDTQLPHIPPTFSLEVFDKAFALVKHDVYLNTWVRYEARYAKPRATTMARPSTPSALPYPNASFPNRRSQSDFCCFSDSWISGRRKVFGSMA